MPISINQCRQPIRIVLETGSKPEIKKVYAWDPNEGKACVKLVYSDGISRLDFIGFNDCEALDADNKYVYPQEVLARMAHEKLPKL